VNHTSKAGNAGLANPSPPSAHWPVVNPQHIQPEKMPDPWLVDSEALLTELARIRDLALHIPATRNELIGPTNSVIDAIWDLEERLRFCLTSTLRKATPVHQRRLYSTFQTSVKTHRPPS